MDEPTAPPTQTTCYRHPDRRAGVRCQRCERPICPACMSTASVGFHCPECARGGAQKVYTRANWSDALRRPLVTQALIALNVVVFLADMATRGGPNPAEDIANRGDLYAFAVADGEWWRVVTAGFLHANVLHILFNMVALWYLGRVLEPALGRSRFLAVYGASLLAGSLGVLIASPDSPTVGASGAIFGLFGALLVVQRAQGIDVWASGLGPILVVNLLFTFGVPGISVGGHLGGLAGGIITGWLLLELRGRLPATWAPTAVVWGFGAACFVASLVVASAAV